MNPSFSASASCLVMDTSGPLVFAGILKNLEWLGFRTSASQPLEALPRLLKDLLEAYPSEVPDQFIFCEGPGSILGIRVACALIIGLGAGRMVQFWSYNALEAAYALNEAQGRFQHPCLVVSEGRKDQWNAFDPQTRQTVTLGTQELNKRPEALYHLRQRTAFGLAKPFRPLKEIHLKPECLPFALGCPFVLRPVPRPRPAFEQMESYALWKPERHR